MKQIIFTVSVLAIPFLTIGQLPSIQWLEVSNERGKNNQSMIGHSEKHYYILNGSKKNHAILQYDFNHQLVQSTSLKDLGSGDKLEAYQIVSTPSGNHLLFLSQTKKEIIFYASKIKEDGSIDTNVQRVFSSPLAPRLGNK